MSDADQRQPKSGDMIGAAIMTRHIIRIFFIVTVAIITIAYLRALVPAS